MYNGLDLDFYQHNYSDIHIKFIITHMSIYDMVFIIKFFFLQCHSYIIIIAT